MPIYYGLNINKAMSDIDNNRIALGNLGLRIENLDLIKGLSDVIDIEEFHTLSGLVDDQKAMIKQLNDSSEVTEILTLNIPRIDVDQQYNYRMSDRLLAGTIKYNYIDFDGEDESGNPDWVSKGADISTSRVSSWSPFGPEDNPDALITYNSDILIKGEFLGITQLGITSKPEARRFDSEVATNTVRININGSPVDVLAMQGIPFKLRMNIKQPNLTIKVTEPPLILSSGSRVPITIVRQDISTGEEILGNNENAIIEFTPDEEGFTNIRGNLTENTEDVQEDYKIYYNVSRIESLSAYGSGIEEWPEIVMENLEVLNLNSNSIEVMPNLDKYAPNIKTLDLGYNPLFNMDDYQNENNLNSDGTIFGGGIQNMMNRLPPSLIDIDLSRSLGGDYSDQRLDLRKFRGMERFKLSSSEQYEATQDYLDGPSPTYLLLGDEYPLFADPATRIENLNPGNSNPDNGATFDLATGIITKPLHGFLADDTILYDVHIGKTSGLNSQGWELGVIGTAMGGLTAGNKYKIDYVSINEFKLKNLADTSTNTLSITSVGSGTAHSITKWDTTKDSIYLDPNVGLKKLETENNNFKFMSTSVLDSPRLEVYEMIGAEELLGSERGKYYQETPIETAGLAILKRYEDLTIDLKTEILTKFTQDGGQINIPDFSKWADTLKTLVFKNVKIHANVNARERDAPGAYPGSTTNWFKSPDSDLNANKFNLNAIQTINISNIYSGQGNYVYAQPHVLGDMRGFMANKPLLTSVIYKDIIGPKMKLDDNAFSGSTSLETVDIKLPGGSGLNYLRSNNNDFDIISSNLSGSIAPPNAVSRQVAGKYRKMFILDEMTDFLGVSGPAGSDKTAKLFDPVLTSLKKFHFNGSGGDYEVRFDDPSFPAGDERAIILSDFSVLQDFSIKGCELSGKIPSFSNCGSLEFFTIKDTRLQTHPLSMTPGNIYSMETQHGSESLAGVNSDSYYHTYGSNTIGNDYNNTYFLGDYIDIGMDPTKSNSDFFAWGDSTSRQYSVPRGSTGLTHNLIRLIPSSDAFIFKYVDADDAVSGTWYTIVDLGDTTAQQWRDLGILPGVTPEVGMQFKARNWLDHYDDTNYPENNGQNLGIKLNRFNIRDAYLAIGPDGSNLGPGDYLKVWRQGSSRGTLSSAYDILFGYNGYPNNASSPAPDGAPFIPSNQWPDDGYSMGEIVQIRTGPVNSAQSFYGLSAGLRGHYVERMPNDRNSFGSAKLVRHTYQRPCRNIDGWELETSNSNNEIIGIGSLKEIEISNTNFYTDAFPVLKQEIIGQNVTKNLTTLTLDNNKLSGSLPDLRNVESLKTISLNRNKFSSYIPGYFSQLGGGLIKIDLSNNKLTAQDGVNLFNDLYDVYTNTGETLTGVSLILNGQDPNGPAYNGTGNIVNAKNRTNSAYFGNPLIIEGSSNCAFTTEISPGQSIRIKYASNNYVNDFADGVETAWVKVASIQNDQRLTLAEVPPGYLTNQYRGFEIQTKIERLSEEALEDNDAALGSPDNSAFEKFKTLNTRWSILIDYDKSI